MDKYRVTYTANGLTTTKTFTGNLYRIIQAIERLDGKIDSLEATWVPVNNKKEFEQYDTD